MKTLNRTIMKKIAFLFLAFIFISMGCTKSDDFPEQNMPDNELKSAEKGKGYTEQFYFNPGDGQYWLPVICDGVEVDYLGGAGSNLSVHGILHFKDGEYQWGKWLVKGTIMSQSTGEIFKIHETNKGYLDDEGSDYLISRTNAVGDQGTHYIFSGVWKWPADPKEEGYWVDMKAKCISLNDDY